MKTLMILLGSVLFLTGCGSTSYDRIDILSFVPGGSTYKHVQKVKKADIDSQVEQYQQRYEYAEYFPDKSSVKVTHAGETTYVSINPMGFFKAVGEDGGLGAVSLDVIKAAIYAVGISELADSGGSDSKGAKAKSVGGVPTSEGNTSGGDMITVQNSGDGNVINVNSRDGGGAPL